MEITLVTSFIGGIGLFLLGMKLMTEGLKLAAGSALRHILSRWTRTPMRGLFSGFMITSMVQSSSAVTVAIIGFVNAGLLTMLQTIYVIYGSNIGTTMTGWLVALVGFKLKIEVLALPMVGVGMLLQLICSGRRAALGEALAGFGLFFLGIDVLKEAFADLAGTMTFMSLPTHGPGLLLFVGAGFLLTFLMQSSSAAMAITLTAAASGIIPLTAAAATVIGTNIGTTSTAALAVIGATPNAKRTAAAHVLFNLITGLVAIILLHPLLELTHEIRMGIGFDDSPVTHLALFHTVFNILGVLLLWIFTPQLVRHLMQRFRSEEEDRGRPRFLDKNVITTPVLGLNALVKELERIGAISLEMAQTALSTDRAVSKHLEVNMRIVERLNEAVSRFGVAMQRANLNPEIGDAIPVAMRIARYYRAVAELAVQIAANQLGLSALEDEKLNKKMADFRGECVSLFSKCELKPDEISLDECKKTYEKFESDYQRIKNRLLIAGASEKLKVTDMVDQLDQASRIRRMMQQTYKGTDYLVRLVKMMASIKDVERLDVESEEPEQQE